VFLTRTHNLPRSSNTVSLRWWWKRQANHTFIVRRGSWGFHSTGWIIRWGIRNGWRIVYRRRIWGTSKILRSFLVNYLQERLLQFTCHRSRLLTFVASLGIFKTCAVLCWSENYRIHGPTCCESWCWSKHVPEDKEAIGWRGNESLRDHCAKSNWTSSGYLSIEE